MVDINDLTDNPEDHVFKPVSCDLCGETHKLDPKTKGRPMKNMSFECGIFCEEKETE